MVLDGKDFNGITTGFKPLQPENLFAFRYWRKRLLQVNSSECYLAPAPDWAKETRIWHRTRGFLEAGLLHKIDDVQRFTFSEVCRFEVNRLTPTWVDHYYAEYIETMHPSGLGDVRLGSAGGFRASENASVYTAT